MKENNTFPQLRAIRIFQNLALSPKGPPQHKNPENFITQVFLPIKNIESGFAF